MKGIILAWWSWTRLYPLTLAVSKQLVPVYDKPMIYYPLSTLMMAWIRDILIISTPQDTDRFRMLLWDGSSLWCHFSYAVQDKPNWLAQAFVIGKDFIGKDSVCLILGDNIFYGAGLKEALMASTNPSWWIIFAYHVSNPQRYGVVTFDADKKAIAIDEKPQHPTSQYAVPWIYFYDNSVLAAAASIAPSARWEYEITDVNKLYLEQWNLSVQILPKWIAWLDTGTFQSLMQASQFVQTIEERQDIKIGCIEEMARRKWYIDDKQLLSFANTYKNSGYGEYLEKLVDNK